METENRMIVAQGWGWGKCGNVSQRVHTFSYRMSKY